MDLRRLATVALGAALTVSAWAAAGSATAQEKEGQYVPNMVYRTGPYAPNGIPFANGWADYVNMLNARDGGINGVPIIHDECDTSYNTDKGVECYEKMKNNGPTGAAAFSPLSTGITYALIERATSDEIPIVSMGYGRADASDGRVFPYVFTLPVTYWAGADAIITYIAGEEGGFDNLKGKKIALVYHDSAYGKEPIPTLEALAEQHGYEFHKFPVAHPGLEQKATWLTIGRRLRPDYVIMWGWGVMNSTAIKEAAAVGFPMDHFIGVWWSGSEVDVKPAGAGAIGYKSAQFHGSGGDAPVHADILKHLYEAGKGANRDDVGTILYNRGLINAVFNTEGVRTAMEKFGNKPMTGEQVQWGLEHLNLTEERIKELGLEGLLSPVKLSCMDHEGGGKVIIQQWDGKQWNYVSDWIEPHRQELIRPMYEASALQYAKEKGLELRDCNQ